MHEAQERILCERQWGRLLPACHPASSERRWAWDPERVGVVPVLRAAELCLGGLPWDWWVVYQSLDTTTLLLRSAGKWSRGRGATGGHNPPQRLVLPSLAARYGT